MKTKIALVILAALLILGWGIHIGQEWCLKSHSRALKEMQEEILKERRKAENWRVLAELKKTDTIVVEKPVVSVKEIVRTELLPVVDTIRIKDTIYLKAERERLEYRDSLVYISASGIMPSIDRVEHYVPRVEKIVVQKPSRWSIGVQAGAGMTTQGVLPYVGVGIQFSLFEL